MNTFKPQLLNVTKFELGKRKESNDNDKHI